MKTSPAVHHAFLAGEGVFAVLSWAQPETRLKEMAMKTMRARLMAAACVMAMAMLSVAAGAQCLSAAGLKAMAKPAAWTATNGGARLLRTAGQANLLDALAPIVGMWHVHLVVSSTTGIPNPPPPGAEIDAGFQQWHSDGTEMLNSGRPAANTNFCMGVWEQVSLRTFRLNHFAISYTQGPPPDAQSGPTNHLTGPTSIVEQVTVSPDGKTFSGTFTIMDYAETDTPQGSSISLLDTLTGTVTGTRIGVNTPVSPIF